MKSFGQAMRNSLPAIGLGLIATFGAVGVAVVQAPSAMAQKATKEFAENINAASAAFSLASMPRRSRKPMQQRRTLREPSRRRAVEQIRAGAYCALNNYAQCIAAIEKARAAGGVPANVNQNYDKQLVTAYEKTGQAAKALTQLKANVTKYGGTADELSYIAKAELAAKRYAEAIKFANQAIAKSSSKPVPYNILLNAYDAQGNKDQFYNTLERAAKVFNTETYWRPFIERARSEPQYRSNDAALDVFRALDAAGVKLSDADKFEWGKQALSRGLAIEAEAVWAPLFKAGKYGGASDKSKDTNLRSYATAQAEAKADRGGALKSDETVAAAAPSGVQYADLGQSYVGAGDFAKAITMFQSALTKGQMDAGTTDLVRLRLGIAQFRAGKKADAVKTWQSIKATNGAAWLARSWIAIAK